MKWLWILTGVWGCAAAVLGAIAAHAVEGLPATDQAALEIATRYHLTHVVAAGLALVLAERAGRLAILAAIVFLGAILCFSGSIYLGVLADITIPVAPVGGTGFMIGWLLLGAGGWRAASRR